MTSYGHAYRIRIPRGSPLSESDYLRFLDKAYSLFQRHGLYVSRGEGPESIELAHLLPTVPETVIAVYVGINDTVCNKGLTAPFLLRHAHHPVFVFDPGVYPGGTDVPAGTTDARSVIRGFRPPNAGWNPQWTYVIVTDPNRDFVSLWREKGYIDTIPAKFEDFTMLTATSLSRVCFFIDPVAFEHPVNKGRKYLRDARKRGEKLVGLFRIPTTLEGETEGLVPVVLERGEKLYVARPDHRPCEHAWSNLHPDNREPAVVNENSAIPLSLVLAKPPVAPKYARHLVPPKGSADMTTDVFYRGFAVNRKPLRSGRVEG
ncbi:MAG: hypothetical protein N2255_07590 [Kiritimatiellae bacterium]|nr:hypothetical protein [Kiritimatiellia bacterium]